MEIDQTHLQNQKKQICLRGKATAAPAATATGTS